jgi:hypothetical protein
MEINGGFRRIETWVQVLLIVGAIFAFALRQENRLASIEAWQSAHTLDSQAEGMRLARIEARLDTLLDRK